MIRRGGKMANYIVTLGEPTREHFGRMGVVQNMIMGETQRRGEASRKIGSSWTGQTRGGGMSRT